ncbi:hypothetical protein BD779DRAFT_1693531, partial [Infundibulicybe gibba]
ILVNRTIDDGLGDLQTGLKVQYLPLRSSSELVWKSQHTCDNCVINPDRTKAYSNTWNSATCLGETVAATFSFHGTAIYIYFITSSYPLPSGITAAANCDFWVDGQFVGNYVQTPASSALKYNILVYANNSLSDALHTFAIQARNNSFMIFDYAQYTTDVEVSISSGPTSTLPGFTPPGPTSSTTIVSSPAPPRLLADTGAIVGGTIAGAAGIALIAWVSFCATVAVARRRFLLSCPERPGRPTSAPSCCLVHQRSLLFRPQKRGVGTSTHSRRRRKMGLSIRHPVLLRKWRHHTVRAALQPKVPFKN